MKEDDNADCIGNCVGKQMVSIGELVATKPGLEFNWLDKQMSHKNVAFWIDMKEPTRAFAS